MPEASLTIGSAPERGAEEDAEPPQRLTLEVVLEDGDWRAFEPVEEAVTAAAEAAGRRLGLLRTEAAVALTTDARIQALNLAYRGKDRPTNVLSFPAVGAPVASGVRHLGDIVLADATVAREAAEEGKPPRHHLQHLVVHGLLHLLGYDHQSDEQALEMERLEAEILADLGIADPYATPA
jgi:probable rRNA maturation factor